MLATEREHPETWPLHFFERKRLGAWPDALLEDVAWRLASAPESRLESAFAKLMVGDELERCSERAA